MNKVCFNVLIGRCLGWLFEDVSVWGLNKGWGGWKWRLVFVVFKGLCKDFIMLLFFDFF